MKRIISVLLVFGLVATTLEAVVATSSTPMNKQEMSCVVGGEESLDCEAIAGATYAVCVGAGGGWLKCTIVAVGAYLGCLVANALIPE